MLKAKVNKINYFSKFHLPSMFIIIYYHYAVYYASSCIPIFRAKSGRDGIPELYAQFPRSTTVGNNTYHLKYYSDLEGPTHESTHPNLLHRFKVIKSYYCCYS